MLTSTAERTFNRSLAILTTALAVIVTSAWATTPEKPPKPVTRCGWFVNPTPGNAWLTDKDAEWIIGLQGGHQAEGDWPDFNGRGWVNTNRSYGYGCACMRVIVNAASREVQKIVSSTVRPLKACREDSNLPKPGG